MDTDATLLLAEALLELKSLSAKVDSLQQQIAGVVVDGWVNPTEAAKALKPDGVRSASHLKSLRLDGAFSEVKREIRNISKSEKPMWEYHVPRCRSALSVYFRRRSA